MRQRPPFAGYSIRLNLKVVSAKKLIIPLRNLAMMVILNPLLKMGCNSGTTRPIRWMISLNQHGYANRFSNMHNPSIRSAFDR